MEWDGREKPRVALDVDSFLASLRMLLRANQLRRNVSSLQSRTRMSRGNTPLLGGHHSLLPRPGVVDPSYARKADIIGEEMDKEFGEEGLHDADYRPRRPSARTKGGDFYNGEPVRVNPAILATLQHFQSTSRSMPSQNDDRVSSSASSSPSPSAAAVIVAQRNKSLLTGEVKELLYEELMPGVFQEVEKTICESVADFAFMTPPSSSSSAPTTQAATPPLATTATTAGRETETNHVTSSSSSVRVKEEAVSHHQHYSALSDSNESMSLESHLDRDSCSPCPSKGSNDDNSLLICLACGKKGRKEEFMSTGRFCSRYCIGLYANRKGIQTKKEKKEQLEKDKAHRFVRKQTNEESWDMKDASRDDGGSDSGSVSFDDLSIAESKANGFNWNEYLKRTKSVSASNSLFKNPNPVNKNGFKVGMKLEAIDPKHPNLFCVCSVAEVKGYRIRLHFDGYPSNYDFWTNADSLEIFPVGWCEKNRRKLEVPPDYASGGGGSVSAGGAASAVGSGSSVCGSAVSVSSSGGEQFQWSNYLRQCKEMAAPKNLFACRQIQTITPSVFRVGMKLEANDVRSFERVSVATIQDVLYSKLLIHFDGNESANDYWCDMNSPLIHPIGWCKEHKKRLHLPATEDAQFTWDAYLAKQNASAVPARTFKPRPSAGFEVGMKLETVDKRNPLLIRVVSVVAISDHRIKLHFDGWQDFYDYWIEDDSPDLHPPGWCQKTGHPLQAPPVARDKEEGQDECLCPTPGCNGVGHIKGPKYYGHHSAFGCPYSPQNLDKEALLDRLLSVKRVSPASPEKPPPIMSVETEEKKTDHESNEKKAADTSSEKVTSERNGVSSKKRRGRKRRREHSDSESPREKVNIAELKKTIHESVFQANIPFIPCKDLPLRWEEHSKLLPGASKYSVDEVSQWSIEAVVRFIESIPGCQHLGGLFSEQQIDGEAFLLLEQCDLIQVLSLRLGPALKIYNSIVVIRGPRQK